MGFANDILIEGYDNYGNDHDVAVCRLLNIGRKENLKDKKLPFYIHLCTILCGDHF